MDLALEPARGDLLKHTPFRHPAIAVRPCEYGWGVFVVESLPAETMLERAPFLLLDPIDTANPPLNDYVFSVTHDRRSKLHGQLALVLGWGSLFNHADSPNVEHRVDLRRRCFEFVSTAVILAGDQCFVSYGEAWWAGRQRSPR